MKRQKTIEIDVCDVCGREGHLPARCCVCQKELCEQCNRMLRVEVHEGHGNNDGVFLAGWTITTANKGYRGVYCPEHSQHLGDTLRAAGFTDFEYRLPWTTMVSDLTLSTGGATVLGGNLTTRGTVLSGAPSELPMVDTGSTRPLRDIGPGAWLDEFPKEPPPPGYTRDVDLNLVKQKEAP